MEDRTEQGDARDEESGVTTDGAGQVDIDVDLPAELQVAASLEMALKALREDADGLEGGQLDEDKITRAEGVAESAAQLDEQIGAAARTDDD